MRNTIASNWRYFDFWLLGAVAVLVVFGITMIRSAVAGNIELTTETNIVNRQIIFTVLGFFVIIITAAIDYHLWASISRTMYIIMVIALASLFIVGAAVFGSARWFETSYFNIQPQNWQRSSLSSSWLIILPGIMRTSTT